MISVMLYRTDALRIAVKQVGVKEQPAGSNRGPMVDKYQDADGLTNPNYGYPWCASFVNWCFLRADRPLRELALSASVGNLLAEARKRGWAHNGTPRPGDLVCFDWNTLNGPGHGDWPDHIGFVRRVIDANTYECVEGNTAVGDDSNGGQVMVRTRKRSMVEGFIRVPGGYTYQSRYRLVIDKRGVSPRPVNGLRLFGTLRRLPGLVKALVNGESVKVVRYRVRIELPKA